MRGAPPVHLALLLIGFVLLGIPLVQLTTGGAVVAVERKVAATSKTVPTMVRVRWAHKPEKLSVKLGAQELVAMADTINGIMETSAELPIPTDGIELSVTASWSTGTPSSALTIELEPDGLDNQSQTRWSSDASLSEIIVYQWKP